jgi:signal transduction histidine kinase/ligand-binding sensor domain-containing protein/ActR/RegA family two-component response regulator
VRGALVWPAVVVGVLAGGGRALFAQELQFRHLGVEDGLANAWVWSILRDSRGFMWFGTATGLSRYNGYSMEIYRHRLGDSTSIADQNVITLYEDRVGTLWVGTRSGLSRYDPARNAFTNYMLQPGLELVSRRRVYTIYEDTRRTLWVGTTSGLYRFDRARGREELVRLPTPPDSALNALNVVQAIWEDGRRHLWIGTERSGLLDFDPATGRTRLYRHDPADPKSLPDNDIRAIVADGAGRLWLGMYNVGLVQLDPATGRMIRYRHDPGNPRSLGIDRIRRLTPDGRGGLWIGTENGGLDHFDPATGVFEHARADPNDPARLHSNSIWALYRDTRDVLWVGTFSGGVSVQRPSSGGLRHFASRQGDSTSISLHSVLGFAEDRSGDVWVATDGGGLNRLDPRTGLFRSYTTHNSNLDSDAVLAVAAEPGGAVWVATWQGGISRLDPSTGRFTAYTTANSDIAEDNIFSLCYDRAGRLWVGTWRTGLLLFDPARRSFIRFAIGRTGLQSQLWLIRELRDGILALGTLDNGVLIFDPATGSMSRYLGDQGDVNALSSSEIRALLEAPDGSIWIGTAAGLDRLDRRTGRVAHYEQSSGLPGGPISALAQDAAGDLWVGTDQGITRLQLRTGHSWQYNAADGLGRDFNPRAYFQARDGTMYFGGNGGFDQVRPTGILQNARRPPVVFTGFQLFNHPVTIGGAGSPLKQHISVTRAITLDHSQSVFTIEFAALDFTAPAKNQYAYRLEAFDRDWIYAGGAHAATYTSLPPGRYLFHVKASNNDGVWNDEGASLAITVLPPFWSTWWFRVLVLLALAGTVALLLESARRRHRYLADNVLEILGAMQRFSGGDYSVALDVHSDDSIGKLRQGFNTVVADRRHTDEELRQSQKMEAIGRLAGGVAHDFNNLLTAIKGNAELALTDLEAPATVREELQEVQRAAERAGSLTRQLLAFSRKQILQPRVLSLNEVIEETGRLLQRTVGEDIELKIELEPALGRVRADPGQIEQVLVNLVVNARDAMPRGGVLTIETHNADRAVGERGEAIAEPQTSLVVRDTGTGIAPSIREHIFEPFFTTKEPGKGTGLGLSTVYGIVKQSGGYVSVDTAPGVGSAFTVYLPRVPEPERVADGGPVEVAAAGAATILLVEDEDAVRRLASRVLERNGYTVLTAACGEDALKLLDGGRAGIDLLLTDVVMPGMSGRELAERLLPRMPGIRLLYTSGYTEDAIVRHGVSGQGTAFLEKPFTPSDLLRKVREVLQAQPV